MEAKSKRLLNWIKLIKNIGKINDSITIGVLGGLIGTIVMSISNRILYRIGKTEMMHQHIAASLLVSPIRTKQRKNIILGYILHLATGSIMGIPLFYMLKKTGKDNYRLKGIMMSAFSWQTLYAVGQKIGLFVKPRLTETHYSAIWNNLVYGLVAARAMLWLADSSVFPEKGIIVAAEKSEKLGNDHNDYIIDIVNEHQIVESQLLN